MLTTRLSRVAQDIIHTDQAGFMAKRKIEDQTKLAQLTIKWCSRTETNGMIVCLDQEKAYDRILHPFLWASLKKFGIPKDFIKTVKALYVDAHTKVILNGEVSNTFKVMRGVRQGDPLSCMLFNLAIESLAQMIRDSNLKGINIGEDIERLIVTLFADDMTVYLGKDDSFQDLKSTLKGWCKASGAKFNIPKTVIVPVGSIEHRRAIQITRKSNTDDNTIPDNIKIVDEGEATRLLGAFIGNNIEHTSVWTPTVEAIEKDLKRWGKSNPTLEGRRLIIGMVVGGRSQYRT